ncbi:hypothetical protein [Sediminibacillus halophilus]|uniref:Uncharacterized protein n=1 Tax=Sediminibacillus halophilus TaxID=482461 RepID=A0A1G9X402_9BACI|nr:hypothetical protein [Sediminibacillus halophilus]SDM91186.1 hypothetical protein SAMN05216244_3733 [Sediminibacillus halophilus]
MMKRIQVTTILVIFLSTLSISLSPQTNIHPSKGFIDETSIFMLDGHIVPVNETAPKDTKIINLSLFAFLTVAFGAVHPAIWKRTAIKQWYPHYVTVFYQSSYLRNHRFDLRTL